MSLSSIFAGKAYGVKDNNVAEKIMGGSSSVSHKVTGKILKGSDSMDGKIYGNAKMKEYSFESTPKGMSSPKGGLLLSTGNKKGAMLMPTNSKKGGMLMSVGDKKAGMLYGSPIGNKKAGMLFSVPKAAMPKALISGNKEKTDTLLQKHGSQIRNKLYANPEKSQMLYTTLANKRNTELGYPIEKSRMLYKNSIDKSKARMLYQNPIDKGKAGMLYTKPSAVNFKGGVNKVEEMMGSKTTFRTDILARNRMSQQRGLSLFGDEDKDGVLNIYDCNPRNSHEQGLLHKAVNLVQGKGFKEDEQVKEDIKNRDIERYKEEDRKAELKAFEQAEREKLKKTEVEAKIAKEKAEIIAHPQAGRGAQKAWNLVMGRGYKIETPEEKSKRLELEAKERTAEAAHRRSLEQTYATEKGKVVGAVTAKQMLQASREGIKEKIWMQRHGVSPEQYQGLAAPYAGKVSGAGSILGGQSRTTPEEVIHMSQIGGSPISMENQGYITRSNTPAMLKIAEMTGNKKLAEELRQQQTMQPQIPPSMSLPYDLTQPIPERQVDVSGKSIISPASGRPVSYVRGHYRKITRPVQQY